MQAIITKFLPHTNNRPSRIKAMTGSGKDKVIYSLTHAVGTDAQNHMSAANLLKEEMGWNDFGQLIQGGTKDGYVFVFNSSPAIH